MVDSANFTQADRQSMMNTANLPDIPALESIEQRNCAATIGDIIAFVIAIAGGILFFIFVAKASFARQHLASRDVGIALLVTLPIVFAFMRKRVYWPDLVWKTDSEGITETGLFHKKHIAWNEVTKVSSWARLARNQQCVMKSADESITIPLKSAFFDTNANWLILASVWQNLRKVGIYDERLLTWESRSLWREIPEDVPQETEWVNPKPVYSPKALLWLVALIGCICLGILARRIFQPLIFGFLALTKLSECIESRRRIRVREDGLEIETPRKTTRVEWWDIVSVKGGGGLVIRYGDKPRTLIIPLNGDPGYKQMTLALIRKLRSSTNAQLLVIPKGLLPEKEP